MAYQGRKVFQAGEVLTASDLNSTVDQTVMVFADTTARDTAIPTPVEGMICYLESDNSVLKYDGSGWVSIALDINLTADRAIITNAGGDLVVSAVTADELLTLSGITSTTAELNILDGVTADANEINILDGATVTTSELNTLDGITATVSELNILDGVTATANELNILAGATVTTAEVNILDGVTADATELNLLDGVTATTAEINKLDGLTPTTTELNYVDGVTSPIQTQLNGKVDESNGTVSTASTSLGVVRNIYVDTADPTGGSDGDVWLKYEV